MTGRVSAYALAVCLVTACTASGNGGDDAANGSATSSAQLAPSIEIETAPPPRAGWFESACSLPPEQLLRIARGYSPGRSHDLMVVPRAPNFFGSFTASTHSGPWEYLQQVPLVFYGPGFIRPQGEMETRREVTSADIAPTVAELVGAAWPRDRHSSALSPALLARGERAGRPRLVVTVVWDGGGRDVLEQWRGQWPNLRGMIEGGTSFSNAVVGTSPSVTPAVHATIGTGVFPNRHGIVDVRQRSAGGEIIGSWADNAPAHLETASLADMYDRQVANAAEIGMLGDHAWHLGMIGHGSYLDGGDRDIGVITRLNGAVLTNPTYYELPEYMDGVEGFEEDVRTVDASDGEVDSKWLGNDMSDLRLARESPAATLYQTRLIKELIANESFGRDDVPDLFFTNYKQVDYVGHRYNMLAPEMRDTLRYTDQELGELTDFLDEWVGEEKWVMVVTADHGSTPRAAATGAWPINTDEILDDLAEHFDVPHAEIVDAPRVTGFWLNHEGLESNGITSEEVANFVLEMRIEDNIVDRDDLPAGYEERLDEPIFSAVWPSDRMADVLDCAGAKA